MKLNRIASGCLAASLIATPAQQAMADGDALVGGIIGGIIGGAIMNEANRNRAGQQQQRRVTTQRPSQTAAQREANREVQVALNYFGYPVGTPDGAIGPRSRSAISQYQATLGYPPTGQLTEYERTILVAGYQRSVMGGPMVAQTVSTHPMGIRGMLIVQRDEMAGIPAQSYAAPLALPIAPVAPVQPVAAPQVPVAPALAPLPSLPVLAAEPAPEAAPGLPSFMGNGAATVSLASNCNKISLMTNTNGGYTSAAAMTDANFALSEQFCLARTYAMATGEELAAKVPGFAPVQIAEQCKAFGPALKDHVAGLSLKPAEDVIRDVSGFVLASGMAPAQLGGTARICLGVCYTTDAMDVAIGSALLLTTLGEKGYAELLGHHLGQGFGASQRPDLALGWYEIGLEAMQAGGSIFAPGLPDRTELIRKAAFSLGGRAEAPAPALPVFAPVVPEVVVALPEAVLPEEPDLAGVAERSPLTGPLPFDAGQAVSVAARLPFLLLGQ